MFDCYIIGSKFEEPASMHIMVVFLNRHTLNISAVHTLFEYSEIIETMH